MHCYLPCLLLLSPLAAIAWQDDILYDITKIKRYWGDATPYEDTPSDYFGVTNSGLPYGCGFEQIQVLQRHGARYPSYEDNIDDLRTKIATLRSALGSNAFSGPLSGVLVLMGVRYLLPVGAAQETAAGAEFWQKRGRLLYNATLGEPFYNGTDKNGDGRAKPLFRTTDEERIYDSTAAWANGFFGNNATDKYNLLVIPEDSNNTLAADNPCANDDVDAIGDYGDDMTEPYVAGEFLQAATTRLNGYVGDGNASFSAMDVYSMMQLCPYEYAAFGNSEFCYLFTETEWDGYAYTGDLTSYYDDSFGSAVGRAQGIGALQELLARLKGQQINSSSTSVNSTLDSQAATFPLGQKFYLDTTHDFILLLSLGATSLLSTTGRVFGISGIVDGALPPLARPSSASAPSETWRLWTLLGLLLGPPLSALLRLDHSLSAVDTSLASWSALSHSLPRLGLAGMLVGAGSKLGSGCTSGHFLCGVSRLSTRSIVATGIFFSVAVVTAWAVPAPLYEEYDTPAGAAAAGGRGAQASYHSAWPGAIEAVVITVWVLVLYELHKAVLYEFLPRQRSPSAPASAAHHAWIKRLPYILCGLTFSLGLLISGMASPLKVMGFLRLLPPWTTFDPSLGMVVLSGVVPTGVHYFRLLHHERERGRSPQPARAKDPTSTTPSEKRTLASPRPLLAWEQWRVPAGRTVDWRLIGGAMLFGIGWGLGGVCPGPALVGVSRAAVGLLRDEPDAGEAFRGVATFLGFMMLGMKAMALI